MTTRRTFLTGLAGIFASGMAPGFAGAGVLMPVRKIVVPDPFGEYGWTRATFYSGLMHDDLMALNRERVRLMGNVAFIDTPRPGGGVDRKWIPAFEFYKAPT
jgi:hypothetical protein